MKNAFSVHETIMKYKFHFRIGIQSSTSTGDFNEHLVSSNHLYFNKLSSSIFKSPNFLLPVEIYWKNCFIVLPSPYSLLVFQLLGSLFLLLITYLLQHIRSSLILSTFILCNITQVPEIL